VGIHSTLKYVFDLKDDDAGGVLRTRVVTGHSYIVYGPLLMGALVHVRGGANLSVPEPLVVHDREVRHQHPVHRPRPFAA